MYILVCVTNYMIKIEIKMKDSHCRTFVLRGPQFKILTILGGNRIST